MSGFYNIEIKARCRDHDRCHEVLMAEGAEFMGEDHQVDTYFQGVCGRLKLRQGKIENTLIHYHRPDTEGPKRSEVVLYQPFDAAQTAQLGQLLKGALGVKIVVDKKRRIYFIGHLKFHLDCVRDLGNFAEIEAIDRDGNLGADRLHSEVQRYMALLGIDEGDLLAASYSDMLIQESAGKAES